MGILDDLKRQADNARLEKDLQEFLQQQSDRVYRDSLRPCMVKIHFFLLELVKQLQTVTWSVKTKFYYPGIGWVDGLEQKNYDVAVDNPRDPKRIVFCFDCEATEEKRYTLTKIGGDEAMQFLKSNHVQFNSWAIQEGARQPAGLVIQAQLRLPVSVAFDVDIDSVGIRVVTRNLESHLEKTVVVPHKNLDDQWLDQFGRYILRKDASFGKLNISEEELARIRSLVESERKRTEQLNGKSNENGLLPKLRKIFSGKPDR
ncbi:MAG: hypothetical protein ACKN9T_19165 [Candidatus Methylumidiphilus sp.]